MRIPRFFTDQALRPDTQLELDATSSHYISNVLRLKSGAPIILFNGDGADYPSELLVSDKRKTQVLVNAQISLNVESPLNIHLAQGISKGDRMDYAIQKAVELGVQAITPVITERCNVKLKEDRWQKKREQWQKMIIAACEQSQRNHLPVLHEVCSFGEFIAQKSTCKKLILAPGAHTYLSGVARSEQGYVLMIGPEGGFSEQEVYTAEQIGFTSVNMGPRILRTETAAAASISVLQAMHGDL